MTGGASPGARPPTHAGGYTVIELVLGLAVLSILMAAMASSVVLASRALPDGDGPLGPRFEADLALDRLAMELAEARAVTERTATAVSLVLPDHDGDGLPERVRYAWSGVAGDPLTRRYNLRPTQEVLPGVERLRFDYFTESATTRYPGPLEDAGEVLVSSHDGSSGLNNHDIDRDKGGGEFIHPELAEDIVAWRPNRIFFELTDDGSEDGQTTVEVRGVDAAGLPDDTTLASVEFSPGELDEDSYEWYQVVFNGAPVMDARHGIAVMMMPTGVGNYAKIRFDQSVPSGAAGHRLFKEQGKPWAAVTHDRLQHYLFGQTYRQGPAQSLTRSYLTRVDLAGTVEVAGGEGHRLDRSVAVGNRPMLAEAFWEADFEASPILLDANFDGQADWGVRDNLAFLAGTLSAGSWGANRTLETRPAHALDQPVEVKLRLAAEAPGDPGARFSIYLTHDSDEGGLVTLSVTNAGDGTQTLELFDTPSAGTDRSLVRMPRLPEGFLDVRLILEPGGRTAALWVSGRHRGTFPFATHMPSVVHQAAWIEDSGGRGRFDYVSIHVGGTP